MYHKGMDTTAIYHAIKTKKQQKCLIVSKATITTAKSNA